MSRIANVSLFNFMAGRFDTILIPEQTIAIRILETGSTFPENYNTSRYVKSYKFNFDDVNETCVDTLGTHFPITKEQAAIIYNILTDAREDDKDVIVHCAAGICRSGAVAQFAVDYLGFNFAFDTMARPNLAVKSNLISVHEEKNGVSCSYESFWENA